MKVKITEEQFKLIVQNISEQKIHKGTGRDPWDYKQVGNRYYVAKKTSPNKWMEVHGSQKSAVAKLFGVSIADDNKNKSGTSGSDFKFEDFAGLQLSDSTSDTFLKKLSPKKLSTTSSVAIFPAGQDQCAQFVNDFSDKVGFVGDAWTAHNNRSLGSLVYTAFENLNPQVAKEIENLWIKINKKGGGVKNGPYKSAVSKIVSKLAPAKPPIKLQLDDVVGIYYPPSSYHELAFHQGGKPYFVDGKPGLTITSGDAWGMNTHVGIVGAIKNGVPLIFHNIHGQVYVDPVNKLKDGGRVVWVRRPGNVTLRKLDDLYTRGKKYIKGLFGM